MFHCTPFKHLSVPRWWQWKYRRGGGLLRVSGPQKAEHTTVALQIFFTKSQRVSHTWYTCISSLVYIVVQSVVIVHKSSEHDSLATPTMQIH